MFWYEIVLGFYIAANIIGALVCMIGFCEGLNWEKLFNPYRIYKELKVNWFGAFFLATISFLCMTPFAIVFYMYKLCTVGKRSKMKKKMFFVEWKDSWTIPYSTVIQAKDDAQAWAKVRRRHPFTAHRLISITEYI